ncbi:MAG: tetratricopeptide repeat protein [Deltaproteobacteria bacterium]|nr:tetratricopeptide repeat protein [Deltaproteobacteria bacterium]
MNRDHVTGGLGSLMSSKESRPRFLMITHPSKTLALTALGVLTILVTVTYHIEYPRRSVFASAPISDAAQYHQMACALAKGHDRPSPELARHTVGYPLVLATIYTRFGCRPAWARIVQAGVGILIIGATMLLALLLFDLSVAVLAGLATLLYGPLLFYESKLMPTVIATFLGLLLLIVAELFRRRPSWSLALTAGGTAGLALLFRPNMLLMVIFLGAAMAWTLWRSVRSAPRVQPRLASTQAPKAPGAQPRKTAKAAIGPVHATAMGLLTIAGFVVALSPGILRLRSATKSWHLMPATAGVTLLAGNHRGANGLYEPVGGLSGDKASQYGQTFRMATRLSGHSPQALDPYEVSAILTRHTVSWIIGHPGQWLALLSIKAYRFAMAAEPRSSYSFDQERRIIPILNLTFLPWSFLFTLGLLGMALTRKRPGVLASFVYIGVFAATALIFFVSCRYRVPAAPVLAVFAAAGLKKVVTGLRWHRWALLGALAAGFLMTIDPLDDPIRLDSVEQYNQAVALEHLGRKQLALKRYHKAILLSPSTSVYRMGEANLLVRMGRLQLARQRYRTLCTMHPRNEQAHINLGVIASRLGRLDDAASALQRAVALDPTDARARIRLAHVLTRLGHYEQAEHQFQMGLKLLRPGEHMEHASVQRSLRALARTKRRALKSGPLPP